MTLNRESGQVLAFFALVLPIVLVPVGAYAVDATIVASREAALQAATAQAAETAAQLRGRYRSTRETSPCGGVRILLVQPARRETVQY